MICYSSYKAADTMKLFIACAPDGTITFLSQCCGGGVSDSVQCVKSGFIKLLEPGDLILADKGTYRVDQQCCPDGNYYLYSFGFIKIITKKFL